jgi:hypothetical protein
MTRLLLIIGLMVVAAVLLRTRPVIAVLLALTLWVALPAVAVPGLTGQLAGPLAIHPATWLVLAVFALQLVFRPRPIGATVARHPLLILSGIIFIGGCVWTSQANSSGGLKLLLDQILAPLLAFLILVSYARSDQRTVLLIRNTIIALAASQAVLTLVQARLGRMLLFEAAYATLPWFNPLKFDRWMGTADSPLILAFLLCVAAGLAIGVRNVALRFGLLGLYLVSVLITQSRTGVGIICAVILYSVLRSRMAIWARALASLAVAGAGYVLVTSTLVAGFASRLADDTGSADARRRAIGFIFANWAGYLFAGEGLTASYTVGRGAGLATSIESSILMYAVDVGWALTLVYFGAQLALILRHGFRHRVAGVTIAASIAFVLPHVSSALAWSNFTGIFLWSTLALVVLAGTIDLRQSPALQRSGAPAAASLATSSSS